MLYFMILIFVLTALIIRVNAGYDSRYNKFRYFTINTKETPIQRNMRSTLKNMPLNTVFPNLSYMRS